ncbi:hypothetical protein [Ideonella sp.]|uniref:hypothetical protein n=1 Tax=Ideonella sp. TaxID=1929293 RepID=UPI0035AFC7C7
MSPAPNDPLLDLLPQWQFEERHARLVQAPPNIALAAAAAYRPDGDPLIASFIALRELPGRLAAASGRRNALARRPAFGFDDFTPIGQGPDWLAFGLVGRFWQADYGLRSVRGGEEFRRFAEPGTARLLLGFRTEPVGAATRLSTWTRIHCPDAESLAHMRRYWVLIRPVSGLIRRRMLARIAHAAQG